MQAFVQTIPEAVFETIGIIGFALYVLNYTLLTIRRVCSQSNTYFVINLVAASFVLIGLTHSFNLASAMIQLFWIAISIVAIVLRSRGKHENAGPRHAGGLTPSL